MSPTAGPAGRLIGLRAGAAVVAFASTLAGATLAGCTTAYTPDGLRPGADDASAAIRRLGPPTDRHARPDGGERLEFARGPAGRHTYMLDFDAGGRLLGWQQVLDDAHFAAIQPGMPRDEVLSRIGHPADVWSVRYHAQQVWTYRYANNDCLVFNLGMTPDGRVEDAGHGTDPRCERRERR